MKKFLSLFVLLSIFSIGVYAQGVSGGVKAGLNMANQTYSGNGSFNSPDFKPSLHGGGYLTVMFTEHLGFQPEILFTGQGAKSGNTKVKMTYVAIPLLVRFNVNKLLSFHAGAQVGLLAAAKYDYGSGTQDAKDNYKSTDIGLAAGGTIDLPMKLNFTLRFIQGLSDINDTTGSDVTVKNYTLQLSVGYRLFGKN